MVLAAITVERNSSSSKPLDCKKYQMEGPHDSSSFALSPPALVHSQSRGPVQGTAGILKVNNRWPVDRFTKTFFWNFQKCRAVLCYILINKQILHWVFCSNIAPSLSSGNHLFYKAEYMRRSCPNQVWAITFDWSALATWNKHFWTAFW